MPVDVEDGTLGQLDLRIQAVVARGFAVTSPGISLGGSRVLSGTGVPLLPIFEPL